MFQIHKLKDRLTEWNKNTLYVKILGLKVRPWRKIFHENTNQKKSKAAILISTKADPAGEFSGIKRGYYIMIKGSVLQ